MDSSNTTQAKESGKNDGDLRRTKQQSSSRGFSSLLWRWAKKMFVSTVCFLTIPMWTMVLCLTLYICLVRYAPWLWLRRALLYLYLPYCFLDRRPQTAGSGLLPEHWRERWLRHLWPYKLTAQYFPVQLHKTTNLSSSSSNKNTFLFCYHPHGVIGIGANAALITNACDFDSVFADDMVPSKRLGVTLNVCFWIPLFREWILAMGFCSGNKETLRSNLCQGNSLVLVPGGAVEALWAQPGTMKLVARRRRGFLQLAYDCHVPVVPCLGFGENATFQTHVARTRKNNDDRNVNTEASSPLAAKERSGTSESNSTSHQGVTDEMIRKLQHQWCRWTSFSLPLLTSMWPVSTPVHVVVGAPVVPPAPNKATMTARTASNSSLDDFHDRYWKAVQELYDQHKAKYGHKDIPLELL